MYIYSDFQNNKIEKNSKTTESKNVEFFNDKKLLSTMTNLKRSIEKKNQFFQKFSEITEFKEKAYSTSTEFKPTFHYNKYENYSNWVQNIKVFSIEKQTKTKRIKRNYNVQAENNIELKKEKEVRASKKISSNILFFENEDERENIQEDKKSTKEELKSNTITSKFWVCERKSDPNTKKEMKKIFDKKLVDHLKLGVDKKKTLVIIEKDQGENMKYLNDKIFNIKKKVLFMKGIFDYSFPKIMVQKAKQASKKNENNISKEVEYNKESVENSSFNGSFSEQTGMKITNSIQKTTKTLKPTLSAPTFDTLAKTTNMRRQIYRETLYSNKLPKVNIVTPIRIIS